MKKIFTLIIVLFITITSTFASDFDLEQYVIKAETLNNKNNEVDKYIEIYSALNDSLEYDFVDNIVINDMVEFSKKLSESDILWSKWCEHELERTRYLENKPIFYISKDLMSRNTTFNSLVRILDIKSARKANKYNQILTSDEKILLDLNNIGGGVFFRNGDLYAKEVKLILAKHLKYTHMRFLAWGRAQARDWTSGYRNFNQNCISLIGSYMGAMFDIIDILSLLIIFLFIKKHHNYTFRRKLAISFTIGFIIKLLVLPLSIVASYMDYSFYPKTDIFINLFAGGLFGIIAFFICTLSKDCFNIIIVPKETRIYEYEKHNIKKIEELTLSLEKTSDYEIASFLYKLMLFRDSKFNLTQIQAFINPDENINIIKDSIIKKLKIYSFIANILYPNNKIAFVWFHTLNAYVSNQNKKLMQQIWIQLKRGFELAKSKYLQDSSKIFNFDNSEFYQIPKGMD